jgi:hypothetical protein
MVGIIINSDETFLKIVVVRCAVVSINGRHTLRVTMNPDGLEHMHNLKKSRSQKG